MSDATIRIATAADIPAIVAIWRHSLALHGERDATFRPQPDGHLAFQRFVEDRLADLEADILVAEREGTVAAYGIAVVRRRPAYFEPLPHGLVTDLDVAPDHRRHGLGERLLQALCDRLRQRGLTRVEAEVVTANEVAVGFWQKQGFATYYQAMARPLD